MATPKELTLGQKLAALALNIPNEFRDASPQEVAALSIKVHKIVKLVGMIRKAHDEQIDLLVAGQHGEDKQALFTDETVKYVRNPRSDRDTAVKITPDYSDVDI